MTNQEAIRLIRNHPTMCEFPDAYGKPYYEALDMAISALQEQELKQEVKNSSDLISRQVAIDAIKTSRYLVDAMEKIIRLPSAQPEWNNHTVACLLAELFDDTCACNYNGIDEWLPEKCEVIDACPNPVGVACWEQFLKHRAERRTDDSQ